MKYICMYVCNTWNTLGYIYIAVIQLALQLIMIKLQGRIEVFNEATNDNMFQQ